MPKPGGSGGGNGGGGNGGGGNGTTYPGTAGDDLFVIASADLKSATVVGDIGRDTLQITSTGNFTFNNKSYKELSGIDVLDFSSHFGGTLTVKLHRSMVSQTDAASLTVVSGTAGIDALHAAETNQGTVFIDGTGVVSLTNGVNNVVTIADGAAVDVNGGSGNDTITASSTGSTLDGGGGSDVLNTGSGADTIIFTGGYGPDTVNGFDVTLDVISLFNVSANNFTSLMALIVDNPSGSILDLGGGDTLQLSGIAKSSLTADNFLIDGQPVPDNPPGPETIYVDVGTTATELNGMIASAANGSTIILRNGTHVFDETITIARSDITLKGESETGTILQIDHAAGNEGYGIAVTAGTKSYIDNTVGTIAKDATSITMPTGHGIAAGDLLYIQQDNTQAYLDENGWSNVTWQDADDRPFREAIAEVDFVDGNTIHLKHQIAYDMEDGLAEVFVLDTHAGVSLSDFTMTYTFGTPNPNDFVNTLPAYGGIAAVYLKGTIGASFSQISIIDAPSHGFDIRTSVDVTADDLYVSGAHNKGSGGNGYGVQVYETFHSSFSNLELFDVRHAFLFSSWHAEAYNTAHVLDTNRDINFHGSPDTDNIVTIDKAVLAYDQSQHTGTGNGYWAIVSPGGSTHPATDIYGDNVADFVHAEGYDRGETIYGVDTGAYLNGKEGQDTIFGGTGDDTLVGGGNKDTLTGDAGADTFVFYLGTNYDTVTDFDPTSDGDQLVFAGNPAVDGFEDLILTQNGSNAEVRFGSNSTVILEGHDIATLTDAGMIFDPTGDTWAPVYFGSDFGL